MNTTDLKPAIQIVCVRLPYMHSGESNSRSPPEITIDDGLSFHAYEATEGLADIELELQHPMYVNCCNVTIDGVQKTPKRQRKTFTPILLQPAIVGPDCQMFAAKLATVDWLQIDYQGKMAVVQYLGGVPLSGNASATGLVAANFLISHHFKRDWVTRHMLHDLWQNHFAQISTQ